MKKLLSLLAITAALAACTRVDTTGISKDSSRKPTGNPDASVVVVEYGDLQCPACKSAYNAINVPLLKKYGTQIRFEFKHFPLRQVHEFAMDLAEASECAADQGKFWEYVDTDYTHQEELDSSKISQWAKDAGVADMALWGRCTQSHIKSAEILADYDEGDKLGVQGTPTYFVNGQKVDSNLQALSAAIDAATTGAAGRL